MGKKGAHCGFPAESSFKGWSTGCARSKQSSDDALPRLVCAEEAMRARRSSGDGDWKSRGREKKNGGYALAIKASQEARGSHDAAFSSPA